jgi:ABC transporter DrrB family efflux protein
VRTERGGFAGSALWQLTWTRHITFLREPEAVFWVFLFPVLMALALGIAFRNQKPQPSPVAVVAGAGAESLRMGLSNSPLLGVSVMTEDLARRALRRGKVSVIVRAGEDGEPELEYDPSRPEARLASFAARDALERAAGRVDRLSPRERTPVLPGSRYIDFLIPGLIGLNLLGTGMWGVGFPIASARQQKLLKRLVATPMRRSDYLLSLMLARFLWLVLELGAIVAFGWIAFGVKVTGSWAAFLTVSVVGAFAFSALGLLIASRARTIEAVSGLMNFAMLPMWLLSGSFFSSDRFPAAMQPFVQALPLTAANDALRAIMNEGGGLAAVAGELAILGAWSVVAFFAALRLFRWE